MDSRLLTDLASQLPPFYSMGQNGDRLRCPQPQPVNVVRGLWGNLDPERQDRPAVLAAVRLQNHPVVPDRARGTDLTG